MWEILVQTTSLLTAKIYDATNLNLFANHYVAG
jgi:hypothetical protein